MNLLQKLKDLFSPKKSSSINSVKTFPGLIAAKDLGLLS